MGGRVSKRGRYLSEREMRSMKERVRVVEEEMREMVCEREKERMRHERDMVVLSFREADWRQERKRLREEVRDLRKLLQQREEQMREMMMVKEREKEKEAHDDEDGDGDSNNQSREWELMGTKLLVQQMKEERVWRDEAVEKWKQLYLAIKTELDDLIQRTYDGDGLLWKAEEYEIQMENLKMKLQQKEDIILALKAQLASMENETNKKEREFDMLRQSLRIMSGSNNKKSSILVKEKLLKNQIWKMN